MAIDVTCELTITNTTSSNRRGVVYFQLDTSGEYFRHEGLVEIQSSTTLSHTFYDVDETITHIIYAYDANFYLLDTYVLDAAMYGELTAILDSTTIHCSFPVNNTSTATLSISIFFSLNSSDAIRYTHSVPPESSYTFTHDFTSVDIYEDNIVYIRDSEFNELDSVTIPGLSPGDIFAYSGFTAVYAEDADYNDVIRCSITVTNNTSISQNAVIWLRHVDYFVQLTHVIDNNSSYTFTYDFENIDIFQENIVTVFNSANQLIDSVTLVATPQFEMYFEATEQNPQFYINLMSWIPGNYIVYDDGTSEEISVVYATYYYKTFAPGKHLIYFSNSKEIRQFRWLTNPETFLKPQIYITNQFWKLSNLQYLYLYLYTSDLWFENITILPNELLRMKKIDTLTIRNIRNCPLKIYYPETLGALQFARITNPQIENNFFQKLSNVYSIQAYLDASSIYSITLPELLFFTNITAAVIFVYFNCPNISRDSNLGSGYGYNFQSSKLTSQACDNLIYVIRNTNNYTGTYAKYLILNGTYNARRTHASDADKAYLLSKGWVVTANEPL